MKTSIKIKIAAFVILATGATLVILGAWVFRDKSWSLGWKPNFGLFIPGIFICFLSLPCLIIGFLPNIARIQAKLHNEALDVAGEDMKKAMSRTADIASPSITTITKSAKQGFDSTTVSCKKCGKGIAGDSEFCKYCGTEQK